MSLSKPSGSASTAAVPAHISSTTPAADGIKGLWQQYLFQLTVNPIRTKALTSAFTAALATIIAQRVLGVPYGSLNWTAVRNQALIGFIRGPTIHYWSVRRAAMHPMR